jgi:hypothetical protein
VPAAASAQSAVDEYQLEIPGAGGSSPADPNEPPSTGASGASASSAGGAADPTASGGSGSTAGDGDGKNDGTAGDKRGSEQGENVGNLDSLHEDTGRAQPLDTSSRSAPEVVADTLLDSAMLPLLAVLALITGAGAWRLLRNRRTLSGQAG